VVVILSAAKDLGIVLADAFQKPGSFAALRMTWWWSATAST
jgi:hypothetical protein